LHSNNVIHRDLKPENIFLHRPPAAAGAGAGVLVKLSDFGWSVAMKVDSRRETLCGTVEYLSPEVAEARDHDFTYDMWMLGCLVYETIVGVSPFAQPADAEPGAPPAPDADVIARIRAGRFRFPAGVSASAADLVTKLLRVERAGRLSPSAVLRHPWVVRHAGVSPRPPPPAAAAGGVCIAPWPELRSEAWATPEARAAAVAAYEASIAGFAAAGVRAAPVDAAALARAALRDAGGGGGGGEPLADLAEFAADARAAEARGAPLPAWAAATAASPAAIAAEVARLRLRGGGAAAAAASPAAAAVSRGAAAALSPLTSPLGLVSPRLALGGAGGNRRSAGGAWPRTPGAVKRVAATPTRAQTEEM
jgi:hypothetical protein